MVSITVMFTLTSSDIYAELSAREIVIKSDELMDRNYSFALLKMKVYRKNKLQKTYEMALRDGGEETMLIELTAPPRNKGEKTLSVGDNLWIYRPKINKVIRISPRAAFAGSDFSNTDILSVHLDKDYHSELLDIFKHKGKKTYKLELTAKSEEVTYAKIVTWIRAEDFVPLRRDFYTISGYHLKTLIMETKSDVLDGMPDIFVMTSALEKNKKSVMQYVKYRGDQTFPEKIFKQNSLKRK